MRCGSPFLRFPVMLLLATNTFAQTTQESDAQNALGHESVRSLARLIHETTDYRQGGEAGNEILRRYDSGKLSDADLKYLIDRALDEQADKKREFKFPWATLVETAHQQGKLSKEQWKRYAVQAVSLHLKVRPNLHRGDPFVYDLDNDGYRCKGTPRDVNGKPTFAKTGFTGIIYVLDTLYLDAGVDPIKDHREDSRYAIGFGVFGDFPGWSGDLEIPAKQWTQLKEGHHTARVVTHLVLYDQGAVETEGNNGSHPKPTKPPLAELDVESTADWHLVPTDKQIVTLDSDSAMRAGVRNFLEQKRGGIRIERFPEKSYLSIWLEDAPPIDVAFDVTVRNSATHREWHAGAIHSFAGGSIGVIDMLGDMINLTGDKFDVIFKPSIAEASRTLTMTQIWGEEVVLHDLPVKSDRIMIPSGPNH